MRDSGPCLAYDKTLIEKKYLLNSTGRRLSTMLPAMPSTLVYDGADGPLAKRQRLSDGDVIRKPAQGSRIFAPFRVSIFFALW
jgi:hypothetical protein